MKELRVKVNAPTAKAKPSSRQLRLPSGASLYTFRQKCHETFGQEALAVFSCTKKRITDIEELERESEVYVFDSFYPVWPHGSSTNYSNVTESEEGLPFKRNSAEPGERNSPIALRVETIGVPRAGKTSLTWRFVKNEIPPSETNAITEAIFEKELDLPDQPVHFSIADVKESEDSWSSEDRLVGKRVLLFCVPRAELEVWSKAIENQLKRARRASPEALLVLAVTKSDLKPADTSRALEKQLRAGLAALGAMMVFTTVFDTYVSPEVVTPEELFAMIARQCVYPGKSELGRGSTRDNASMRRRTTPRLPTPPAQPESDFWFLRPFRSITSCFVRSTR